MFKITKYTNGNLYRITFDTIDSKNEKLDVYFFKKHFNTPYYLPDKLVDNKLKNKTVAIWATDKAKKDYQFNWENTYKYDSLGFVTNYGYSSCLICSQLPYHYNVTYNSNGQVENIIETDNKADRFQFHYNDKGEISQCDQYLLNKLVTSTVLLN